MGEGPGDTREDDLVNDKITEYIVYSMRSHINVSLNFLYYSKVCMLCLVQRFSFLNSAI